MTSTTRLFFGAMFGKSSNDIVSQFDKLANGADAITIAELPDLATALQIQPDDIAMYIVPWKLNAATPLRIAKQEWVTGLQGMKIDSLERLRLALPNLRSEVSKNPNAFRAFYNFVFEWTRETTSSKSLPNESACDLWELLFAGRSFPLLGKWLAFIRNEFKKPISRDLWRQTLDFAAITDLSKYDPNGAWPTAMDLFVEWNAKQSGPA